MKKFIFSQIILFACVFSTFSQVEQTLDEKLNLAIRQNLPQWKTKNLMNPFNYVRGGQGAAIEANWTSGSRKANLRIYLLKSEDEIDKYFTSFLMRGVIPPNRRIENLGDRAHLVETASKVEVEFAKSNTYSILNIDFPDTRGEGKIPSYYAPAPKEEVEAALHFARIVADTINGKKTFSPCFNNFYRPQFPPAVTLEERLRDAIQKGEIGTVKSLIGSKANLNHIFPDGETSLHLAVRQGCAETVKNLIAAQADVNAKTAKGFTPLMIAANYGDLEMVKFLVAAGANVNAKDVDGKNAAFFVTYSVQGIRPGFSEASSEAKSAVIKYLVSKGLNINERENLNGDTLLTSLLYNDCGGNDCALFINLFLELGADINAENKYGRTALINSVERINATVQYDFVKLLLARGANPNHKDKNNLSALGYALKDLKLYENDKGYYTKHIRETIRLLKDAGAIE